MYSDSTCDPCKRRAGKLRWQRQVQNLQFPDLLLTYGGWVSIFTAVAMCCFAFSTIIGWGLYGARCIEFLFSAKVIRPFMIAYSLVAILGATVDLGLLWSIAETFNGLMAIPKLNWCISAFRNCHYTYERIFCTEEITIIAGELFFRAIIL